MANKPAQKSDLLIVSPNGRRFDDVGQAQYLKTILSPARIYFKPISKKPGLCPPARQTEPRNMDGLERAGRLAAANQSAPTGAH